MPPSNKGPLRTFKIGLLWCRREKIRGFKPLRYFSWTNKGNFNALIRRLGEWNPSFKVSLKFNQTVRLVIILKNRARRALRWTGGIWNYFLLRCVNKRIFWNWSKTGSFYKLMKGQWSRRQKVKIPSKKRVIGSLRIFLSIDWPRIHCVHKILSL